MLGLDAREFAAIVNISLPTLRNAESGERNVSLDTIERIQAKYEELGIEFTLAGRGYGAGVRWKVRKPKSRKKSSIRS